MACLAPVDFGNILFYFTSISGIIILSCLPVYTEEDSGFTSSICFYLLLTNMSWACSFDRKAFCDSSTWISKVFCWHWHTATAHPDAGLLSDCECLRAATFTMVVVPTGTTRRPEACKFDTADDLAFFGAFQAKCRTGPLQLLLGRDPAIDLARMILGHVCTYTCCLLSREGYLVWVTTKLLEKD